MTGYFTVCVGAISTLMTIGSPDSTTLMITCSTSSYPSIETEYIYLPGRSMKL